MRAVGAVSLGLAFSSIISSASAGEVCARAQDLTALQVAAVQQHLMVAALACNDAGLYNTFVVTYRDDLQASDATLKAFFARLAESTGKSEYDAFKTKLANDYSLNSNRNKTFCRAALAVFRAALNEKKTTLASFALSQPMAVDHNYPTCGDKVDGGSMTMKPTIVAAAPAKEPLIPGKQETTVPSSTAQADSAPPAPVAKNNDAPSSSGPYATRTYDSQDNNRQTYRYSQQAPQYTQRPPQYSQQPPQYSQQSPSRNYRYPARNPYAVYPYAANPYARSYSDDYYSYCSRYGERDPYCRNPYSRYWYGGYPPQSYLRRP